MQFRPWLVAVFFLSLSVAGPSVPAMCGQQPVGVGLQKQLMVDDYVIAEKKNVTRELGEVKKHGVVLKPSLDTDFHPSWKKPDGSRVALPRGMTP